MKPFLTLALLILTAGVSQAAIGTIHTLLWKAPRLGTPRPSNIVAVWDGKPIGDCTQAEGYLANLDISSKDSIRIDMPEFEGLPKLNALLLRIPPYAYSRYIVNWYDKRVLLHFFRKGKEYPVHTLGLLGYGHLNEESKKPFHLFYDGKDLGLMDDAIKQLDAYQWQKDAVVQLLPFNIRVSEIEQNVSSFAPVIYLPRRITAKYGVAVEELSGTM